MGLVNVIPRLGISPKTQTDFIKLIRTPRPCLQVKRLKILQKLVGVFEDSIRKKRPNVGSQFVLGRLRLAVGRLGLSSVLWSLLGLFQKPLATSKV